MNSRLALRCRVGDNCSCSDGYGAARSQLAPPPPPSPHRTPIPLHLHQRHHHHARNFFFFSWQQAAAGEPVPQEWAETKGGATSKKLRAAAAVRERRPFMCPQLVRCHGDGILGSHSERRSGEGEAQLLPPQGCSLVPWSRPLLFAFRLGSWICHPKEGAIF